METRLTSAINTLRPAFFDQWGQFVPLAPLTGPLLPYTSGCEDIPC
jgi:hypothetical protein